MAACLGSRSTAGSSPATLTKPTVGESRWFAGILRGLLPRGRVHHTGEPLRSVAVSKAVTDGVRFLTRLPCERGRMDMHLATNQVDVGSTPTARTKLGFGS